MPPPSVYKDMRGACCLFVLRFVRVDCFKRRLVLLVELVLIIPEPLLETFGDWRSQLPGVLDDAAKLRYDIPEQHHRRDERAVLVDVYMPTIRQSLG